MFRNTNNGQHFRRKNFRWFPVRGWLVYRRLHCIGIYSMQNLSCKRGNIFIFLLYIVHETQPPQYWLMEFVVPPLSLLCYIFFIIFFFSSTNILTLCLNNKFGSMKHFIFHLFLCKVKIKLQRIHLLTFKV